MDLFILDYADLCSGDIKTVVDGIKYVFTLIQWAIPAALIILGTIDMFKAMTSGDDKETKAARDKFIKRLIYALVAFLIPFIVSLVFTFAGQVIKNDETEDANDAFTTFLSCWNGDSTTDTKKCYDKNGDVIEDITDAGSCVSNSENSWK